jgi:HAD superfamily hydrolase (TIGR01509 family)
MIQTIAFDFGNVLGPFSHQRGCQQLAALTGGRYSPQDVYRIIYSAQRYVAMEDGSRKPADFLRELAQTLAVPDLDALALAYSRIFDRDEAVCALLPRLRVPKLLASNTDPLHWVEIGRLFQAEIAGFAPGGLIRSYAVRCRKPAPQFFEHVLQAARRVTNQSGLPPQDVLFIDDLLANCQAAQQQGLSVHHHVGAPALVVALTGLGLLSC